MSRRRARLVRLGVGRAFARGALMRGSGGRPGRRRSLLSLLHSALPGRPSQVPHVLRGSQVASGQAQPQGQRTSQPPRATAGAATQEAAPAWNPFERLTMALDLPGPVSSARVSGTKEAEAESHVTTRLAPGDGDWVVVDTDLVVADVADGHAATADVAQGCSAVADVPEGPPAAMGLPAPPAAAPQQGGGGAPTAGGRPAAVPPARLAASGSAASAASPAAASSTAAEAGPRHGACRQVPCQTANKGVILWTHRWGELTAQLPRGLMATREGRLGAAPAPVTCLHSKAGDAGEAGGAESSMAGGDGTAAASSASLGPAHGSTAAGADAAALQAPKAVPERARRAGQAAASGVAGAGSATSPAAALQPAKQEPGRDAACVHVAAVAAGSPPDAVADAAAERAKRSGSAAASGGGRGGGRAAATEAGCQPRVTRPGLAEPLLQRQQQQPAPVAAASATAPPAAVPLRPALQLPVPLGGAAADVASDAAGSVAASVASLVGDELQGPAAPPGLSDDSGGAHGSLGQPSQDAALPERPSLAEGAASPEGITSPRDAAWPVEAAGSSDEEAQEGCENAAVLCFVLRVCQVGARGRELEFTSARPVMHAPGWMDEGMRAGA
jgi:hypothetical protein